MSEKLDPRDGLECRNEETRREFLRIGLWGGALLLWGGASALLLKMIFDQRKEAALKDMTESFQRTRDQIAALENEKIDYKAVDMNQVVPEHSRTAQDVLVALPYYHPVMGGGYGSISDYFFDNLCPMLRALPQYSRIHIIVPDNLAYSDAGKIVSSLSPNLVKLYPAFNAVHGAMYVQDVGEALGSVTETGQFRLVSPGSELEHLKGQSICHSFGDKLPKEEKKLAVNSFHMDNVLAKLFPGNFVSFYIDADFMGGNLTFGTLPNGEKCVFVSKDDIGSYIMCKQQIDGRNVIPEKQYFDAKDKYCQALGTRNVIVIDEDYFLSQMKRIPLVKAAQSGAFFHNDMIFSQHLVNRRSVMAVSSMQAAFDVLEGNYTYNEEYVNDLQRQLTRIMQQLSNLGYEIVEVPFFTADLNFVNVIPYIDKNTDKPQVILPSYHFDAETDRQLRYLDEHGMNAALERLFEVAYESYQNMGIGVHSATYKQNPDVTRSHIRRNKWGIFSLGSEIRSQSLGGFHCRMMVLR